MMVVIQKGYYPNIDTAKPNVSDGFGDRKCDPDEDQDETVYLANLVSPAMPRIDSTKTKYTLQ